MGGKGGGDHHIQISARVALFRKTPPGQAEFPPILGSRVNLEFGPAFEGFDFGVAAKDAFPCWHIQIDDEIGALDLEFRMFLETDAQIEIPSAAAGKTLGALSGKADTLPVANPFGNLDGVGLNLG